VEQIEAWAGLWLGGLFTTPSIRLPLKNLMAAKATSLAKHIMKGLEYIDRKQLLLAKPYILGSEVTILRKNLL